MFHGSVRMHLQAALGPCTSASCRLWRPAPGVQGQWRVTRLAVCWLVSSATCMPKTRVHCLGPGVRGSTSCVGLAEWQSILLHVTLPLHGMLDEHADSPDPCLQVTAVDINGAGDPLTSYMLAPAARHKELDRAARL